MVLKKYLVTVLIVIFALIAALATYVAHRYRFTNPPRANFFDAIDYLAMGAIFLLAAKINLGRTPQHPNLAIFAGVVAGFVFSYAAEKLMPLMWK
jgi:predicted membrane channel-forming protein YqfA (hemolysin III family)